MGDTSPDDDPFDALLTFYRRHRHHHVPNFGPTRRLYAWLTQVRERAEADELPAKLRRKLEGLDFPFDEKGLAWERSFAPVAEMARRQKRLPPAQTPAGAWIRAQLELDRLGEQPPARSRRLRELSRACKDAA